MSLSSRLFGRGTGMEDDLIKKLRACSADERKQVAVELAQSGMDEAIKELIKMVEGRRRYRLSWYRFPEQLVGIECLGQTGSKKALTYLETSIKEDVNTHTIFWSNGNGTEWETEGRKVTYPNARGRLRTTLNYLEGDHAASSGARSSDIRSRSQKSARLYEQIKQAIRMLDRHFDLP